MAKKDLDVGRLVEAIRTARQSLRRYREERREAVRQYVGQHYAEEGTREKVPVNLLALYTSIVGRQLVAKNPRVMLSTFVKEMKPLASAMEGWANEEIERLKIANVLQRCVLDALFSIGICKVALVTPAEAAESAYAAKAGEPCAHAVDLDDFVFDVHARDLCEAGFVGHRYRVPLDAVKDSSLYSKARKDLAASEDSPYNLDGDERINLIGRGNYTTNADEFEPHVDLWEIYVPRRRLILTLAHDDLSGAQTDSDFKPLREQEWLGPDSGPYHYLSFGTVPGNPMPKAPIHDLIDLHELVNSLYRKLARQAERQKENLLVTGGASEDGSRIMESSDGEVIRVDNPDRIKVANYGSPNQANFLFAQHAWELFSKHAGNLEMMGGLAPQSKTLGQDKLLAENASALVGDMQVRTVEFTSEVMKAMCWYWWHDPFRTMRSTYNAPGVKGVSLERAVKPQDRQKARFNELGIRLDAYSMMHSTPQSRAAALNQIVQQVVIPLQPILMQQGITFDINAYLSILSKYLDMPDLGDILTMREPVQTEAGGQGQATGKPGETTRNYVRRSLGGDSEQAGNAELKSLLQAGASSNGNGQVQ